MPLTGERLFGWQIEDNDHVVINGDEVTIQRLSTEDDDMRWFIVYNEDTGDVETLTVGMDILYDEWGA
jgi:hypothetical protein